MIDFALLLPGIVLHVILISCGLMVKGILFHKERFPCCCVKAEESYLRGCCDTSSYVLLPYLLHLLYGLVVGFFRTPIDKEFSFWMFYSLILLAIFPAMIFMLVLVSAIIFPLVLSIKYIFKRLGKSFLVFWRLLWRFLRCQVKGFRALSEEQTGEVNEAIRVASQEESN